MQPGEMPNALIDRLNEVFGPGFVFDSFNDEVVREMWSNAAQAAELVSSELGLVTEKDIEDYACDRVVDAWRVLLYGESIAKEPTPDQDENYPVGELMPCYDCTRAAIRAGATLDPMDDRKCVQVPCVKLGRVVNPADPTQTYVLACGHVVI